MESLRAGDERHRGGRVREQETQEPWLSQANSVHIYPRDAERATQG